MTRRLAGRTAVVTGAGNGVGRAIAMSLAEQGARVVVNDLGTSATGSGRSSDAADRTVDDIRNAGGEAVANHDSVADVDGCAKVVQTALDSYGPVDIMIANAGAVLAGTIQASDEELKKVFDLVVFQKFWLSRLVVPGMVERGYGRIVSTASEGARGKVGKPLFGASMGATVSMMKALATDLAGTGVTANVLAPGAATRTYVEALPALEQQYREGKLSEEMWNRAKKGPGPVEHVPPIVTWLCTDAAASVTGHVFHSGGGRISVWSEYEDRGTITKGDPDDNPPYTLDELDTLVPGTVLKGLD